GFEPADILLGILAVVKQIKSGQARVANEYRRVVKPEGNVEAQAIMDKYLIRTAADWRGLGIIPDSGLKLRPEYSDFEAVERFSLKLEPDSRTPKTACRCGDVLKGLISPADCPLFGRQCRPDSPQGPCMVSYEGACLIEYKFSGAESHD
ncbi:MAG TPA: hydrogenase formation protein HypD, partial [Candidatus Saccharicenans sp.]|nr:hydrogenase formation protein HypD [Candidatus Saccharicenans sp.]HQI22749.1 hydrogenase formation protein HypD [Candidatus Saccharicenans sp.]